MLSWIRLHLLPAACEEEGPFRQEVQRLSHAGLRTIGIVESTVPVAMHLARWLLSPERLLDPLRLAQTGSLILVGQLTLLAARLSVSRVHGRKLALVSAWLAAACLVVVSALREARLYRADDYVL